jgi:hypothetical protein
MQRIEWRVGKRNNSDYRCVLGQEQSILDLRSGAARVNGVDEQETYITEKLTRKRRDR